MILRANAKDAFSLDLCVRKQRVLGGFCMVHRGAIGAGVVSILLANFPGVLCAQVDCNAAPAGPARTDCYLALSQFYRGQSDLAAAKSRAQSDAAWFRAITGIDPPKHQPRRRRGKF